MENTVPDNVLNIRITANADGVQQGADDAKEHLDSAAAAVGVLGDLVGVTVPEALQKALAGVEGLGTALNAAFIPLQVISFLEQIEELRNKVSQAAQGLSQGWVDLGGTVSRFNQDTQIQLLQLAQRLDGLRGNQLARLEDKLKEIDAQSLKTLGSQFDAVAKKADSFFASMEVGWFKSLFTGRTVESAIKNMHQEFGYLIEDIQKMEKEGNFTAIGATLDAEIAKVKDLIKSGEKWTLTAQGKEILAANVRLLEILQDLKGAYTDVAKLSTGQKEEAKEGFAQLETANRQVVDFTSHIHEASKILQELDRQSKAQSSGAVESETALANLNNIFAEQAKRNFDQIAQAAKSEAELEIAEAQKKEAETEAAIVHALATHKISKAQEVQQTTDAKVKELDQEIQYWKDVQGLYAKGSVQWNSLQKKVTEIEKEQIKLRIKDELDGMKVTDQAYKQLWSSIGSTFKSAINGLIQGNETIQQAFQKLYVGLLQDLINYEAQQLERKVVAWAQTHLLQNQQAGSQITTAGAVGAAWAYADLAATGPAGLAAAPAAAAATQTAIDGFNGEAFAASGGQWEVPGLQLTMLHPREMVLPAGLANQMRNVITGGGGAGAVYAPTLSINAIDGDSVARIYNSHIKPMMLRDIGKYLKTRGLATS